jgi:FkbM family methyltransferase
MITPPQFVHLLGRAIGTRFHGIKGVDRIVRTLHHPDKRQHSWMETIANATLNGPQFNLSTRWFTEWTTWFYGSQDHEIHQWIRNHAQTNWIAFDIGVNFGFFTCVLAQCCESVHGFEPVPWLAKRARANVELNRFCNVSIAELALSDCQGKAHLNLPSEDDCNWGTSSLVHKSSSDSALEVKLETLDDYIKCKGLNRLDFIKLDVEGAEHLVLKGANKSLAQFKPVVIFERNIESSDGAIKQLRELDYSFFDLHEEQLGNNIEKWPHDILAIPKIN